MFLYRGKGKAEDSVRPVPLERRCSLWSIFLWRDVQVGWSTGSKLASFPGTRLGFKLRLSGWG